MITVFRGKSGQANGVVQAEEVKNRLKKFLADAEEEVDEAEEGDEGKGDKLDKAAAKAERIASFMERSACVRSAC